MNARRALVIAGILGLTGVAAGAFGAHGLRETIDARALSLWETGARYQQIHAAVLLALAVGGGEFNRPRRVAATLFLCGILVFSGTLYAMALGGPRFLGAVTPLGGLSLIGGWAAVVWLGLTARSSPP